MYNLIFLRIALILVMLTHSLSGMFDGSINGFGTQYLDKVGFAPIGLPLAWFIKLSHIVCALSLALDKYTKIMSWITIFILVMGIFMVHLPNGWFVVGGGTNGIEYNVVLILAFLTIIYPKIHIKNV